MESAAATIRRAATSAVLAATIALGCVSCAPGVVAAATTAAGFTGSGVTIYKKATENSPLKAEFVLIKFESNHIEQIVAPPTPAPK